MTNTGQKELLYSITLKNNEFSEYISSLPYTIIEECIEEALKDNHNGFFIELLYARIEILKNNLDINSKKALRKLLKVCQILGCIGCFDFGDWDKFLDKDDEDKANNLKTQNINTLIDISIKVFPESADANDKKMLNKLASSYLIDRILSEKKIQFIKSNIL